MPKPEDIAILRLESRLWHTRCGLSGRCFVVVVVVKYRCAADLGRKTVHEEEWCRHETALFVPCAIAGFTIPFGMSLPMAQHKAVFV